MSGHCKGCGVFHEEDDSRLCTACESEKKVRLCKHDLEVSPSGKLALCRKCPFVGVWRDGMWERAGDGAARVQVTQWLREIGPHADIERARVVRMAQRIAGAHNP